MKIKVSDATNIQLDWMVEYCLLVDRISNEEQRQAITSRNRQVSEVGYSTDWAQGGPIIEREHINTAYDAAWRYDATDPDDNGERWYAELAEPKNYNSFGHYGPTPLIAAMRCYVAGKLGDEVEIPEELK